MPNTTLVVCYNLTGISAPTKNLSVSWQFLETCGVTSYGTGWRMAVVNQCLELGLRLREVEETEEQKP